jgi:monovalent cation:H+ antiporter-2, CPA2 family
VPEIMEGSLMLASHALVLLGVPLRRVVHRVQVAREERYESLRGFFFGATDTAEDAEAMQIRLHTVVIGERSKAIGKRLLALDLASLQVEVNMIRRGKNRVEADDKFMFEVGDVIVFRGNGESVMKAEQRVLK